MYLWLEANNVIKWWIKKYVFNCSLIMQDGMLPGLNLTGCAEGLPLRVGKVGVWIFKLQLFTSQNIPSYNVESCLKLALFRKGHLDHPSGVFCYRIFGKTLLTILEGYGALPWWTHMVFQTPTTNWRWWKFGMIYQFWWLVQNMVLILLSKPRSLLKTRENIISNSIYMHFNAIWYNSQKNPKVSGTWDTEWTILEPPSRETKLETDWEKGFKKCRGERPGLNGDHAIDWISSHHGRVERISGEEEFWRAGNLTFKVKLWVEGDSLGPETGRIPGIAGENPKMLQAVGVIFDI